MKEFQQIEWDERTAADCREVVRLAVREDLGGAQDLTTVALVAPNAHGKANLVAREPGIVAGISAMQIALKEMKLAIDLNVLVAEGNRLEVGIRIGELTGATRDILVGERILLNLLGRMSGIATLADRFVREVAGTRAAIYDTRKTTPGWRRLEKYAVRCGGGCNHRLGLFDAVLIKDNHLAQGDRSPADAIRTARQFLRNSAPGREDAIIEIEVDTWQQYTQALDAVPDIILLDNMSLDMLKEAVQLRDQRSVETQLEASGGITLERVRAVAQTGVDRISVGSLTHSAVSLDVGLDW